ncbi:hypothetical protein QCA50_006196 [Cerrena zonata]|uniref:F-box domain-containing protein n=1 Tax=Cerrena zonata TaxID=2478898 RepID=A0AAW0GCB6_9APHY
MAMRSNIYERCEGVTDSDILTIEKNIRSRQETIRKEILIIVEKKRYLNSLLPISRLPGEVLLRLFRHCSSQPVYRDRYPCFNISHVCYNWRELALQTPEMWNTFCLGHPECVKLLLERSGMAPLQVTSSGRLTEKPHPLVADSLKLVLKHSHRVEALTLEVSNYVLEDAFGHFYADVCVEPKSAIQRISLLNLNPTHSEIPNVFSALHLPALTCIEIRGYQMVWHPPLLQFTTLNRIIIHSRNSTGSSCGILALLQVLRNNPRMKVLEFVERAIACSGHDNMHVGELPLVDLQYLETLKIHTDAACINLFLTRCNISVSTITDIETRDEHHRPPAANVFEENINILRSIISHVAQRSTSMSGLELSFNDYAEQYGFNGNILGQPMLRIILQTYHFDTSPISIPSIPHELPLVERIRFSFRCPSSQSVGYADTLRGLLHILPLSGIARLKLDTFTAPSDTMAKEVGAVASGLIRACSPSGFEILELSQYMLLCLPFILSPATNGSAVDSDRRGLSLFRALHTLILSRIRDTIMRRRQRNMRLDFGDVFDALQSQAVLYRGTCGRFSRLILKHCSMEVNTLYELVDCVSDITCQRGRFTINPPTSPYRSPFPPPIPLVLLPPPLVKKKSERLPDADLDNPPLFVQQIPTPPPANRTGPLEGEEVCWDAYVRYSCVTFDFRGSSGVQVEHE